MMTRHIEYDFHISAETISKNTIAEILELGFDEDALRNNLNSAPPHFHASFKHHYHKPKDDLWNNTKAIVEADSIFRGCLEEEMMVDSKRCFFSVPDGPIMQRSIPCFKLSECEFGEHKECDIHITIDPILTSSSVVEWLEQANFISFDRLRGSNWCRIFSLTFEATSDAEQIFSALKQVFLTIPGLNAKMKLEYVHRFLVVPKNAGQLPIVRSTDVAEWLSSFELRACA